MSAKDLSKYKRETVLGNVGRDPDRFEGVVNPPVFHASTILYSSVKEYQNKTGPRALEVNNYGRIGTSTTRAVEQAVATLEGGDKAINYPSGLAAVAGALTTFLSTGDHLLIADNVYAPSRSFCRDVLTRYGVEIEYFDPMLGADIRTLFRAETKVVYFESPGSQSFEVLDVPAVCSVAKDKGIITIMDNTWSAGYYFKPFDHGVDVSVQAATKYHCGHADAMLGFTICKQKYFEKIKINAIRFGTCAGPDVCNLGLRGIRTLDVRMPRHYETSLKLAEWLAGRDEVKTVLHPALSTCPGHDVWKRDFTGASGLFGVILNDYSSLAVEHMIDGLELYGLGDSWGGYESLLVPSNPKKIRTATQWPHSEPGLRIHAGLENFEDLRDDLATGLKRLRSI
jgi:cystathionine beta-lyase